MSINNARKKKKNINTTQTQFLFSLKMLIPYSTFDSLSHVSLFMQNSENKSTDFCFLTHLHVVFGRLSSIR